MTEVGAAGEPPVEADGADAVDGAPEDDGWPQLSELDLDVCLSATLPRDGTRPGPPREQRPQA